MGIESLRAILELERRRGYSDTAVIGGLDAYLDRWAGQIKEKIGNPRLLRRFKELKLANSNYKNWGKQKDKNGQQRFSVFWRSLTVRENKEWHDHSSLLCRKTDL